MFFDPLEIKMQKNSRYFLAPKSAQTTISGEKAWLKERISQTVFKEFEEEFYPAFTPNKKVKKDEAQIQ